MFELCGMVPKAARTAAMNSCMHDVRSTDQSRLHMSTEASFMAQRVSSYKKYEDMLRVVTEPRNKGMDELKVWIQEEVVDVMGKDFHFPEHVAVFVKYHYDTAEESIDKFVCKQLKLVEDEWAAGYETPQFDPDTAVSGIGVGCAVFEERLVWCISIEHAIFKGAVTGAMPSFTDSAEKFSGKYGHSLSSCIEERVRNGSPTPCVSMLVDMSRVCFQEAWSKKLDLAYEKTVQYEAKTHTFFNTLLLLNKTATLCTYRRGVLIVLAKSQDIQFLQLHAFVETLRKKHGVFADGTGTHIQAFLQKVLAEATTPFNEQCNVELTIQKWAGEMMKHHDKLVIGAETSVAWLQPDYAISEGSSFHDVVNGVVASGTMFFKSKLEAASVHFGLPDNEFREQYLPGTNGAKRPVAEMCVSERPVAEMCVSERRVSPKCAK